MKKLIVIALVLLTGHLTAQADHPEILKFAQKNYMSLLGNIPEKNLSEFGLGSKNELRELKFAAVFTEYAMRNNKLSPTQNYRVLLLNTNNQPCGMLTVFNSNGQLSVADYGALELSKELAVKKQNISSGAYAIYRNYSKQCDYLFDEALNKENAVYHKLFSNNIVKYNEAVISQK